MKTVYYYWAPWCSMCPKVGPVLEDMCQLWVHKLVKINVDIEPLDPRVASYTSLPIVLIDNNEGEIALAGPAVTVVALDNLLRP